MLHELTERERVTHVQRMAVGRSEASGSEVSSPVHRLLPPLNYTLLLKEGKFNISANAFFHALPLCLHYTGLAPV